MSIRIAAVVSARVAVALTAVLNVLQPATSFAQSAIPIRELAIDAKASEIFGIIRGVRPLTDGRILVNDNQFRQLLTFDERFGSRSVVFDSMGLSGQTYNNGGRLIPYLADSTLFVDFESKSLLVISPSGKTVRVTAVPNTNHLSFVGQCTTGVDAYGNLVYRGDYILPPVPNAPQTPEQRSKYPPPVDSSPILRANFETRAVDTIARVKVPAVLRGRSTDVNGELTTYTLRNPIAVVDEFAVLSSGTVAIVRSHDYHVDFIAPDGKINSSPKLSYDWKVFTDAEKQHIVDSAKIVLEKRDSIRRASLAATGPAPDSYEARLRASSAAASQMAYKPMKQVDEFVPFNEMPSFWPSIRENAATADLDDNLWVLPTTTAQSKNGELVYDVVNRKGELFQRVRLPLGRIIAGFGRNGVVFLAQKDATSKTPVGWYLEKAHIVK